MIHLTPDRRVFAGFALHAMAMGSIFPRLPEIRDAMGVGEGTLGLSLIGTPVGTLIALTFATPLLERMGFRRALMLAIPLVALIFAVAVHATDPRLFFFLLIPAGLLIGSVEIILNVEADRVEAVVGRRIMNRAHSFWSIGFFAAGLIGAGAARFGVSPQWHLGLMVPLLGTGVLLCLSGFAPSPKRVVQEAAAPRFASPTGPILVLVAVTFSALLMEGAGIDWSAIYMTDTYRSEPFVAGLAVAMVAGAQAIGRFFSDGFVERHGPAQVARAQLSVMAVGLVLLMLPQAPALSLLAFALVGFGTSVIFPLAVSAAAQRTDRPSAINVAAFAQIAFVGFLLGPPLLGLVAETFGIHWVYGMGLPLVAVSLWAADALGRRPGLQAA